MPITEPIDEDELESDLAALEQEKLDEQMLKTGTVPVADALGRTMPAVETGPGEFFNFLLSLALLASFSLYLSLSLSCISPLPGFRRRKPKIVTANVNTKQSKARAKRKRSKRTTRRRS